MQGYVGCLAHSQEKARKQKVGKRQRLKNYGIRTEAIYQYIYTDYADGIQYLARRHPKRYPKHCSRKRHNLGKVVQFLFESTVPLSKP